MLLLRNYKCCTMEKYQIFYYINNIIFFTILKEYNFYYNKNIIFILKVPNLYYTMVKTQNCLPS